MSTYKTLDRIRNELISVIIKERFKRLDDCGKEITILQVNGLSKYQLNSFIEEITRRYNNIHFIGKEGWNKKIRIGEDKYTPVVGRIENNGDSFNIVLDKREIMGIQNVRIMEDIINIAEKKLSEKESGQFKNSEHDSIIGEELHSGKLNQKGFLGNKKNFSWELSTKFFDYHDSYIYP